MLSPGTEKCPRCGKRLRSKAGSDEYTARDIASISLYIIGIALIPIGFMVLVTILCVLILK
jgi:hypothetical protein